MSGGYTSLGSSIRTCKVNTGNAERIESDRFLGCSEKKVCPSFLGTDLTGRNICPDSFMTKSAGCNTSEDRIFIENTVSRPHYYEFINLSSRGLDEKPTFGFGLQGSSYLRESSQPCGCNNIQVTDDLPPDLRFNASQPMMPTVSFSEISRTCNGVPYSQFYGQHAEDQRLKQALYTRAEVMGQNPINNEINQLRYGYKMLGEY